MQGSPVVCPAATPVHEADDDGVSVLCGVLALSNEGEHIKGRTAAGQVSPLMSGRRDPNTVRHACCGDGVPGAENSYCSCVLWRAQRDAEHAGRHGRGALRDPEAVRQGAARAA